MEAFRDIEIGYIILEELLELAKDNININVSFEIKNHLDLIINNINSNKSIISVLITSALKKIIEPKQDIRLHKSHFKNGYSARSLDTKVVTPFMKKHFIKYANKETGFLTLSFRTDVPWYKENLNNLTISKNRLNFIEIINYIQENPEYSKDVIIYIFYRLLQLQKYDNSVANILNSISIDDNFSVNQIIMILKEHFSIERGSRLPVIAIYSIYEFIFNEINRYSDKKLLPINSHTSSDIKGFGDIHIYYKNNIPFEVVEVKHNLPINHDLIYDVLKKCDNVNSIKRYYILTTYESIYSSSYEKEKAEYILNNELNIKFEIIIDNVFSFIKSFLIVSDNPSKFIEIYKKNVLNDFSISTEVNIKHIDKFKVIIDKIKNNNFKD